MSNKFSTKNGKIIHGDLTLDAAETNIYYTITGYDGSSDTILRLAEMGLTKNAVVRITKKAPLGDPIELSVRGYSLCLRANDAKHFTVKESEKCETDRA